MILIIGILQKSGYAVIMGFRVQGCRFRESLSVRNRFHSSHCCSRAARGRRDSSAAGRGQSRYQHDPWLRVYRDLGFRGVVSRKLCEGSL